MPNSHAPGSTVFTIAQASFGEADVSTLPPPPVLERWLFENPWPGVILLVVLSLAALLMLNRAARLRQGLIAGVAGLLLAAGLFALSTLVSTERERLALRTRELISAAAGASSGALRPLLDDRVAFALAGGVVDRDRVLGLVEDTVGRRFPIKDLRIGVVSAVIDGENVARTQVRVWARTEASLYDAPVGSTWRIDWRRDLASAADTTPGPWLVSGLTPLQIDGVGDASRLGAP